MRCSICKYAQSYIGEGSAYYEEDSCTLCYLTSEDEQTEINTVLDVNLIKKH